MERLSHWLVCLAFILAHCAHLPPVNERLAAGYASITAMRGAALQLLEAKKIAAGDAENVQRQCDRARSDLDRAQALATTDEPTAQAQIDAILTSLGAWKSYLQSKGSP